MTVVYLFCFCALTQHFFFSLAPFHDYCRFLSFLTSYFFSLMHFCFLLCPLWNCWHLQVGICITWSDIFKLEKWSLSLLSDVLFCSSWDTGCVGKDLFFFSLLVHLQWKHPPWSDAPSVYRCKTLRCWKHVAGVCCVRQTACVITWESAWHASVFVEVLCLFS